MKYQVRLVVLFIICLLFSGKNAFSQPSAEQCAVPNVEAVLTACEEEVRAIQEGTSGEAIAGNRNNSGTGNIVAIRSNTGYIDNAIVQNRFRIRYDWSEDIKFPDRAEFIYGQCNCGPLGVSPGPASDLDIEEAELTMEQMFTPRFSLFTEIPYRDVDLAVPELPSTPVTPARQLQSNGIGDIRLGAKYALITDTEQYLTFQLRAYLATGDEAENLGTGHSAIEPSVLYYRRLNDAWSLETEARWWHPTGDYTDYAGDVLRFGAGFSHTGFGEAVRFSPVIELVGWYVTDGMKTNASPLGVEDASGDTIVNLKLGARIRLQDHPGSVYAGFGFALTDEDWYDQIFRIEYRHSL